MTHELSSSELRAIVRTDDPTRRYQVDASLTIVVHDLDALRAAARRAFDHGRFASEQERARAWAAIADHPDRLISQAIDFARLTEDIPGILGHTAEWTVRRDERGCREDPPPPAPRS
ncbi:hypothetical protein [Actinophytocola gossypii]|uniref:DUF222 domain-containing protein n=1 Tax=Actinophytocola gossypii TaxID=2812003 RepID=A0ABT2JL17_9PSEU|nr:hypothetical protein [Actinophytocola gossypii]MCT2588085.1 hypothetical protein [Actinophytocola gossypii]